MTETKQLEVWLVLEGDYEMSVESVHASEASAKAFIKAARLESLKRGLKLDLDLADDAAERREARRVHRERVGEVESGDVGDYRIWKMPVLDLSRESSHV